MLISKKEGKSVVNMFDFELTEQSAIFLVTFRL